MHSLRPILDEAFEVYGDKSQYVVAAPQYRAAANTAMGWKNSNLRTEMTRLLRRAGVSGCPRLFHYGMLAKQAQTGPESGARHLRNRDGMLAKQARIGPEIRCQAPSQAVQSRHEIVFVLRHQALRFPAHHLQDGIRGLLDLSEFLRFQLFVQFLHQGLHFLPVALFDLLQPCRKVLLDLVNLGRQTFH